MRQGVAGAAASADGDSTDDEGSTSWRLMVPGLTDTVVTPAACGTSAIERRSTTSLQRRSGDAGQHCARGDSGNNESSSAKHATDSTAKSRFVGHTN